MAKRFLVGSSFFFLFFLFLWGVYTFFFSQKDLSKKSQSIQEIKVSNENTSPSSPESQKKISIFIDAPVISPWTFSKNEESFLAYIDKNTGSIQSIHLESKEKKILSEFTVSSPMTAIWQNNGDFVYVKELREDFPTYRLFYLNSKQPPLELKKGIQYLIWDELQNAILYSFKNNKGEITLNKADLDGSKWKELAKLDTTPIFLATVPKSPLVAFWTKPTTSRIGEIKTTNITSGETKSLYAGKSGADYLWSPDGEKILISWSSDKDASRSILALLNKNGGGYEDLNFPTLAKKCVWANDNVLLYCALPGSIPQGSILPDAYFNKSFESNDTFWKINTQSRESERLVSLEEMTNSLDASELLLSPDESQLFFVNRKDLKVYSINL